VEVFIQNRYLIDNVRLDDLPLKTNVRIGIERLWFFARMGNADEFFVQTPEMKRLLNTRMQGDMSASIKIVPFVAEPNGYARSLLQAVVQKNESCEFLHMATGGLHKNHRRLIEAWCLLTAEGLSPLLRLTLNESQNQEFCLYIEEMRQRHGLNIAK
jgi:hypothetical protein